VIEKQFGYRELRAERMLSIPFLLRSTSTSGMPSLDVPDAGCWIYWTLCVSFQMRFGGVWRLVRCSEFG